MSNHEHSKSAMSGKVALLGDSIFDNGVYTGGEPDVVTHLRGMLPGWQASLLAIDGSIAADLPEQLKRVQDESHLVISLGGNDALQSLDLFEKRVKTVAEALVLLERAIAKFEQVYRAAIGFALALDRETTLCTIYGPDIGVAGTRAGLMLFNDVILRVAFEHHLPVIDLRSVCTEPQDFVHDVEPSGQGGRKVAAAVAQVLAHPGTACAHVYAQAEKPKRS
jgi:hypothetical protein